MPQAAVPARKPQVARVVVDGRIAQHLGGRDGQIRAEAAEVRKLHNAIRKVLTEAVAKGGRDDELDLSGRGGRYVRLMDRRSEGRPCPNCGTRIEKIQYLGGACYFCPNCQPEA